MSNKRKAPDDIVPAKSRLSRKGHLQAGNPSKEVIHSEIFKVLDKQKLPVYEEADEVYQRSIATANLMYRYATPDCVVMPYNISEIQAIVKAARKLDIPITIKNGGHAYSGSSSTNTGILMDLFQLHDIELDANQSIMRIEGGTLWGNVYKELINDVDKDDLSARALVMNGGRCATVGVSGFLLGGGLGPFSRSFGMGCDCVVEATLVVADGSVVTVGAEDDPDSDKGKLFWAIRGGGGGNFGILVEVKISVQRLKSRDGSVVAGRFDWYPELADKKNFTNIMNDFYTSPWSNQMTIDSTWVCDRKTSAAPYVRFTAYYDGDEDSFMSEIREHITSEKLQESFKNRTRQIQSKQFFYEALAELFVDDIKASYPENKSFRIFSSFVFGNDLKTIRKVTALIRKELGVFRTRFKNDLALVNCPFIHAGGAINDVAEEATAFPWRNETFQAYLMVQFETSWLQKDMEAYCKSFKEKLSKYSVQGGSFINFPDNTFSTEIAEQAYYGQNLKKLQEVKAIWDPDNYFSWEQSIQLPAAEKEVARRRSHDGVRHESELWDEFKIPSTRDFIGQHAMPYYWYK